jgi:hypothetical protein
MPYLLKGKQIDEGPRSPRLKLIAMKRKEGEKIA